MSIIPFDAIAQPPIQTAHKPPPAKATAKDLRGTAEVPLVVRAVQPEKSQAEIDRQNEQIRRERNVYYGNIIGLVATLCLVGVYLRQTKLMNDGVKATTDAANATKETARLMLMTEEPIIVIEAFVHNSDNGKISVHFGNHGRTPALFKAFQLKYFIGKNFSNTQTYDQANITEIRDQGVADPAHEFHGIGTINLSTTELKNIFEETERIWVFGYADFEDFTMRNHRFKFCRIFLPNLEESFDNDLLNSGRWLDDGPASFRGTQDLV